MDAACVLKIGVSNKLTASPLLGHSFVRIFRWNGMNTYAAHCQLGPLCHSFGSWTFRSLVQRLWACEPAPWRRQSAITAPSTACPNQTEPMFLVWHCWNTCEWTVWVARGALHTSGSWHAWCRARMLWSSSKTSSTWTNDILGCGKGRIRPPNCQGKVSLPELEPKSSSTRGYVGIRSSKKLALSGHWHDSPPASRPRLWSLSGQMPPRGIGPCYVQASAKERLGIASIGERMAKMKKKLRKTRNFPGLRGSTPFWKAWFCARLFWTFGAFDARRSASGKLGSCEVMQRQAMHVAWPW